MPHNKAHYTTATKEAAPHRGIATLRRFLYLQSYAFLLIAMGGGIALIILLLYNQLSIWLIGLMAAAGLLCLKGGITILSSWPDKKRKYQILIERNAVNFRPDTFTEFMQAPCGRLLSRIVLKDLGISHRYSELRHLRKPFTAWLYENCRPRHTVITYHRTISDEQRSNDAADTTGDNK